MSRCKALRPRLASEDHQGRAQARGQGDVRAEATGTALSGCGNSFSQADVVSEAWPWRPGAPGAASAGKFQ